MFQKFAITLGSYTLTSMRLHYLLPKINGIPVLMYHHIMPGNPEMNLSTVTVDQLREQWGYLKAKNYICLSLPKFLSIISGKEPAPKKSFLLTFDDGYLNNLNYAYPMLQEFGWQATIFLIGINLKKDMHPASEDHEKLNVTQLSKIDPNIMQFGMHGYDHENFSDLSIAEADKVVKQMIGAFDESGLQYFKVLAYPFGARPKKGKFRQLEAIFQTEGIIAAFRVGNKPQVTTPRNSYQLKRIDIRGSDSIKDFAIKLEKGKLKPF